MADSLTSERHPCGCTAAGHRWLSLCAQHAAESRELHERVQREYRERRMELLAAMRSDQRRIDCIRT